jgi:hypothetical protein
MAHDDTSFDSIFCGAIGNKDKARRWYDSAVQ